MKQEVEGDIDVEKKSKNLMEGLQCWMKYSHHVVNIAFYNFIATFAFSQFNQNFLSIKSRNYSINQKLRILIA